MPFDIIRRSRGVERSYYAGKNAREKTDFVKLLICRHFLKKERWVRNLTVNHT